MTFHLLQKKKGKKRAAAAEGEGEAGAIAPTPNPKVSPKNLQELLHKLTVDEQNRPHLFWDTQPVPKLGTSLYIQPLPPTLEG